MLAPVSADFIALCRLQLSLLVQGFNASQSAIYLAEDWQEGNSAALHPILCYPDEPLKSRSRELDNPSPAMPQRLLPQAVAPTWELSPRSLSPDDHALEVASPSPCIPAQVVLPLVHEKFVMGLLTVERLAPSWSEWEQAQLEKIAQTIAISCLFDQQNHWLLQDQSRQTHADDLSLPQREVLDNILHQLKSPVTAIRTFGKLLLRRLQPQDENRQVADRVIRETDHLQDLLQQVQQLLQPSTPSMPVLPATVDANAVRLLSQPSPTLVPTHPLLGELHLEPCFISDLLSLPLASAAAISQEQQQELQVELLDPLPLVMVDPQALREVVMNIVDNALKYTPRQGQISIRVFADLQGRYAPQLTKPGVAIAISDTGPGIPIADQPQLFQRHYRGQQAQGDIPGTGLGLAIARNLMLAMQGDVRVWSPAHPELSLSPSADSLSTGSTFLIWIPLVQNGTIV